MRRDPRGPRQPPPLPAAALPGGHRDPLRGRDRSAAARGASPPRNVEVELAEVTASTSRRARDRHAPATASPFELPYDSLIVAAGAGQSYFGHDEFSRWAAGNEDDQRRARAARADPRRLRDGRARGRPGRSGRSGSPSSSSAAGRPGVEIAGQIAELSRRVLKDDFRQIDSSNARVLLFDGGKEVLAGFGDRLSGKAAQGPGATWVSRCTRRASSPTSIAPASS